MKNLKRFDHSLYKYNPHQVVVRLNDIVDSLNGKNVVFEQQSTVINSKEVIVYGNQPDGTFGVYMWDKEGDAYTNKRAAV